MPASATCPSCGAPLGEAAVLSLAPVCSHCKSVLTRLGGTLGLIGAYGVNDPTIARRRVEADLEVFRQYQEKYAGMKAVCVQDLNLSVESYAQLPPDPSMLTLKAVPSLWSGLTWGVILASLWYIVSSSILEAVWLLPSFLANARPPASPWSPIEIIKLMIIFGGSVIVLLYGPFVHFGIKRLNGNMPAENARRQRLYEEAVTSAMNTARLRKATEDHRLRAQIMEIEGLAQTLGEKEAEVRRLLASL